MDKERRLDILKSKIEEADAIVVGGASGMSAASGFMFYYQDDEVFRQLAGSLREKYGFRNMFDGFYNQRMTPSLRRAVILPPCLAAPDCLSLRRKPGTICEALPRS